MIGPKVITRKVLGERGIVLPLIAVLAAVLLAAAALVIDTLIGLATKHQMRIACEAGSMAALETFLEEAKNVSNPADESQWMTAFIASRDRANQIMGASHLPFLGRYGDQLGDLGIDYPCGLSDCSGGPAGRLIPGTWAFEGCTGSACFTVRAPGDLTTNAFRCETNLVTPLRTVFARIFGKDSLAISAFATAAEVPRHVQFVVDLSNSISSENYLPLAPECEIDPGGAFDCPAYFASRPGPQSPFADYVVDFDPYFSGMGERVVTVKSKPAFLQNYTCDMSDTSGCHISASFPPVDNEDAYHYWSNEKCYWCGMESTRPATLPERWAHPEKWSNFTDPTIKHYKDDFNYLEVWDHTGGVANQIGYYVDTYPAKPGRPAAVNGAEPLKSVLRGINEAITQVRDRSVSGDMVGFFAFGEQIFSDPAANCCVDATNCDTGPATCSRVFRLADASHAQRMLNATDVDRPFDPAAPDPDHYLSTFLFPRTYLNGAGQAVNENSDLTAAIGHALTELQSVDGWEISENSIVLFTDGLGNCSSGVCSNSYSGWDQARNELRSLIPNLEASDVRVNVFLFGRTTGPHTLNISQTPGDTSGDCVNDATARYYQLEYTNDECSRGGCNNNYNYAVLGSQGQFFGPNGIMYELASTTGGVYAPIRPMPGPSDPVNPNIPCWNCSDQGATFPGCQDRILYDPDGRSLQTQISDAVGDIMGAVPMKLVD